MRVFCDANLFISYLLSRARASSAVAAILQAATARTITLLFTPGTGEEIRDSIRDRADLKAKIADDDVEALLGNLDAIAVSVPRIAAPPRVSRDPDDDYVIACEIAADADYIVTWDKDLLGLGQVDGVRVVTPAELLRVLREEGRLPG